MATLPIKSKPTMLKSSKQDLSQKPIYEAEQDDKFFTKFVSKEISIANPSFRGVYYGDLPGAIPFLWETQPGTPKHKFFKDHDRDHLCLPPTLTPPPSYYFTNNQQKPFSKTHSNSKLLHFLFLRIHLKKTHLPTSPPSSTCSSSFSSSSSYSSSKSTSIPSKNSRGRRRRLLCTSSLYDDDNYQVPADRTHRSSKLSILCFRA